MQWIFKKYKTADLYNFLYVSGHKSPEEQSAVDQISYSLEELSGDLLKQKLDIFLNFASSLTENLEKFAITNFTPALDAFIKSYDFIPWEYEMLANDLDGMGIDRGFQPAQQEKSNLYHSLPHHRQVVVLRLVALSDLVKLPEESFDESSAAVSIFALARDRQKALVHFLNQKDRPQLQEFLSQEEIFVHIICARKAGFFDALLLKAKTDIEHKIRTVNKDSIFIQP